MNIFNPQYDDKKIKDNIYYGNPKIKENGVCRSVEMLFDEEKSYMTEKNKEPDSIPVTFNIKDKIELYETSKGQQKYFCWLLESDDERKMTALHIARRKGEKTYSTNEVTLNPNSVYKLIEFLNSIKLTELSNSKIRQKIETKEITNILSSDEMKKELGKNSYFRNNVIESIKPYINFNELLYSKEETKKFVSKLNENSSQMIYDEIRLDSFKLNVIKENIKNNSEIFWQDLFTSNPNILFSIIPSVFQMISDHPYLGGKSIENKNGIIGDFLFSSGAINSSIIEIKTPCTELINKTEYRKNTYSPSSELSGAIVQIRRQKDKFLKEYLISKNNSIDNDIIINTYDPKSYLILGNTSDLSPIEKESFELFRNELKDIEIITYDELIKKIELIISVLIG